MASPLTEPVGTRFAVVGLVDAAGPPTRAAAAVEGWARTLASTSTRRAYRAAVTALLAEHGEITPGSVAAWRDAKAMRGLRRATVRQRLAGVRALTASSVRSGLLAADQAAAIAALVAGAERG